MSASCGLLLTPLRCSSFSCPRHWPLWPHKHHGQAGPSEHDTGKDEVKLLDPDMYKPTSFDLLSSLFWPLPVGIHQVKLAESHWKYSVCCVTNVRSDWVSLSLSTEPRRYSKSMQLHGEPILFLLVNSICFLNLIKLSWINLLFYVTFLHNHCFIKSKSRSDQLELDSVGLISSLQYHKLVKSVIYHTHCSRAKPSGIAGAALHLALTLPAALCSVLFPKHLSLLNLANQCIKAITSRKNIYIHTSPQIILGNNTGWSHWQITTTSGFIFTGTFISLHDIQKKYIFHRIHLSLCRFSQNVRSSMKSDEIAR